MAQVLDYSAGFPGADNIHNAGFAGAVRYIGFPPRRKCATKAELDDFRRRGIGMALVYQDGTGDFLGGFAAGMANANRARGHATIIGFPDNRPIYMAVDRDTTPNDLGVIEAYLRGAAVALGPENVGVYGEFDVVRAMVTGGHARYGWQTAAWSHGARWPGTHLYQRIGTARVGGIDCDVNDVLAADWGQHNYAANLGRPEKTMLIQGGPNRFNAQAFGGVLKQNLSAETAGADRVVFPRLLVTDAEWDAMERRTDALDALPGQVTALASEVAELRGMLVTLLGQGVTLVASGQITIEPSGGIQ